jgi:hypothetical protein
MAIAVEKYQSEAMPPRESTQPAVEALNFIAGLELPKSGRNASRKSEAFFYDHQLGRVFAAIVETHGTVTYGAGGYQQLRGDDGRERFLATYFPEKQDGDRLTPGSFHAFIDPMVAFNKPSYTIPVTIPMNSGIPTVMRSERGDYGRQTLSETYGPQRSMAEVRHLADLMSRALQGIETAPGAFEVIR